MWPHWSKNSWSYISVLWLLVIFILLLMSTEDIEIKPTQLFPNDDKVIHAGLFGIWSFCLIRASLQRWNYIKMSWIVIALTTIAITTEVLQGFTTYRTSDPWDVLADLVGAVIVLLVFKYWITREI